MTPPTTANGIIPLIAVPNAAIPPLLPNDPPTAVLAPVIPVGIAIFFKVELTIMVLYIAHRLLNHYIKRRNNLSSSHHLHCEAKRINYV